MEKLKPTHDLEAFKRAFARERPMTYTAARTARSLGYNENAVANLLAGLRRSDFVKSMTSFADHKQWQDVYHIDDGLGPIYLKFTDEVLTEFVLLSFKRK